jgi:hypothetical protein
MALGFRTIRLQLRFLLPLVVTLVVAASLAVPLLDRVTLRWFTRDLNARGLLVANALSDSIAQAVADNNPARLAPLFERTVQDERVFAVALCSPAGALVQSSGRYPQELTCGVASRLAVQAEPHRGVVGGAVHVGVHEVLAPSAAAATSGSSAAWCCCTT